MWTQQRKRRQLQLARTCVAADVEVSTRLQQAPDQVAALCQPVLDVHLGGLQMHEDSNQNLVARTGKLFLADGELPQGT